MDRATRPAEDRFGGGWAVGWLFAAIAIGSVLGGQIKLHRNFDKDLQGMKDTLECVEAVLVEAEKRAITDNTVLLWLKNLKDSMYAISDLIDDFEDTHKVPTIQSLSLLSS